MAATATVALAGSGVGGVFNLGQTNTVNRQTELRGTTGTQQLLVRNLSPVGNSAAVVGFSANGTGVWGRSQRLGLRATASATAGEAFGVYSTTSSANGLAAFFQNTATNASAFGGQGIRAVAANVSPSVLDGYLSSGGEFAGPNGALGIATHPNGSGIYGSGNIGVRAIGNDFGVDAYSDDGYGVRGTGGAYGVLGSGGTTGVQGAGTRYGVYGRSSSSFGYGLYSEGNAEVVGDLTVIGNLSKSTGSFKIDHPLDPANKYLSHSFVESPDMMNIYNGNVVTDGDGVAVVELPDYFEALNSDPRYQLTVIGSFAAAQIAQKVSDNRFVIRTSEPGVEVSWQVTGIRQDAFAQAHPIIVEEEKAVADRGRYLHPVEHGQPETMAIGRHVAATAEMDGASVR